MDFLGKIFKAQKPHESDDNLRVVLKTNKNLSEEQRNAIITIAKDGAQSSADLSEIAIKVIIYIDSYDELIINRIKDGIELTF